MEKNGSAVDAAIAVGLCNGVINMQSMGIGGGHLMTVSKIISPRPSLFFGYFLLI